MDNLSRSTNEKSVEQDDWFAQQMASQHQQPQQNVLSRRNDNAQNYGASEQINYDQYTSAQTFHPSQQFGYQPSNSQAMSQPFGYQPFSIGQSPQTGYHPPMGAPSDQLSYPQYTMGQSHQTGFQPATQAPPTNFGYEPTSHTTSQYFGYQPSSETSTYSYSHDAYSQNSAIQSNMQTSSGGNMDNYLCSCCHDLLIEPTTLKCGHSFCRLCLAQWFLNSNKMECMICKTAWLELPQVSYTLRSTIENMFSEEYQNRLRMSNPLERERTIREFENKVNALTRARLLQFLKSTRQVSGHTGNTKAFVMGIVVAVIIWVLFRSFGWKDETLASKPVSKWTKEDCQEWLDELGEWTQSSLAHEFETGNVDGHMLLALSTPKHSKELDKMLEGVEDENRLLFIRALTYLSSTGKSPPSDLWNYKNLHFGKVVWLQASASQFPRLTIFYLYLFDYEASYLPLIHIVCPDPDVLPEVTKYTTYYPPPTWGQTFSMIARTLLFPYLSVFHPFITRTIWYTNGTAAVFLCMRCWIMTIAEIFAIYEKFVKDQMRSSRKHTVAFMSELFVSHLIWGIAWLFWMILPSIIINPLFYYGFFVQPVIDIFVIMTAIVGAVILFGRPQ